MGCFKNLPGLFFRRNGGTWMTSRNILLISGLLTTLMVLGLGTDSAVRAGNADEEIREAIRVVLSTQQDAWNRGDIRSFMEGYWNSPDLSFAGSSGVTRGWQSVLERYEKNYPDREAMGKLDFTILEIRPLNPDAALVIGRWHLKKKPEDAGGVFSLVFQKISGKWKIVHDHTSADAKP